MAFQGEEMKFDKATAVMLLLVLLAGACILGVITLEIVDGLQSATRIDKLGVATSLKPLLKTSPLDQWVVVLFGGVLLFSGLAVLTWNYQKRI